MSTLPRARPVARALRLAAAALAIAGCAAAPPRPSGPPAAPAPAVPSAGTTLAVPAPPPAAAAALEEARAALSERRLPEALQASEAALAAGGGTAAATLRGRVLGLAGRFDEAAAGLEAAVAADASALEAWSALAAVQVNRGDDEARDRALAGAARISGRRAALERFWTQLLAMPPDPIQPQESLERCTRGYVAMLDGAWFDAQREQLSALRNAPGYGWCLVGVARSTWRLGEPERAEQLLRRVLAERTAAADPVRADALAQLAELLLDRGRAPQAADLAREALAARGDRPALLRLLAAACAASGQAECRADAEARLARRPAPAVP